ncbi:hypothetical protein AB0I45_05615 [Brevibacterium sp. NPDC049920]|uniref:D-hexose-6-phosphate mutarotase n=1 Tax=Brevibacterium pityocampae TaxID=506594 RepID=A0ABP8J1J6_9MICO
MVHPEDPNTAPARDDLLSAEDFLSLPSETLAEGERGRIDATRMGAVDLLVLRFDTAVAVVSRFGAQVLAHRPAGRPDTLFTSSLARFDTGAAIRGGIPVCWPWFGPASTPQHGWARLHTWDVEALAVDGTGAEVRLGFSHRGAAAGLTVRLGDGLSVELAHRADPVPETTTGAPLRAAQAPGATPAPPEPPVTAALHAYFAVGDAQRTEIAGVTDRTLHVPAEGIDSVFPLAGTAGTADHRIVITDPALGRRLTVTTNATDAVVWNPAQQLGDTTARAHHGFVCVEPARISSPLPPGDTLRMHLAVD